jgi:predicted amidophosphoribosyltransferase
MRWAECDLCKRPTEKVLNTPEGFYCHECLYTLPRKHPAWVFLDRHYDHSRIIKALKKYTEVTNKSEKDFWKLLKITHTDAIVNTEYVHRAEGRVYFLPVEAIPIMSMLLNNHPFLAPLLKVHEIRENQ